jgi:hypothetical protein
MCVAAADLATLLRTASLRHDFFSLCFLNSSKDCR